MATRRNTPIEVLRDKCLRLARKGDHEAAWAAWIRCLEQDLLSRHIDPNRSEGEEEEIAGAVKSFAREVNGLFQFIEFGPWMSFEAEMIFASASMLSSVIADDAERRGIAKWSAALATGVRDTVKVREAQLTRLRKKLNKYRRKGDPKRVHLFGGALKRYIASTDAHKLRRGYTYTKALAEENAHGKHFEESEFDLHRIELENHFKKWRHERKRGKRRAKVDMRSH